MSSYKILLCGDGGSGKTTFIKRCRGEAFDKKYIPTMGVEVHPLVVDGTTHKVWDLAGQEKFGGLRDAYFINADAAIIMLDLSNSVKLMQFQLINWMRDVRRVCPDIPIIIALSKFDVARHPALELATVLREKANCPVCVVHSRKRVTLEPFKLAVALIGAPAKV